MTINIQNASTVNVTGYRTSKNCKAVYCITTGEFYASATDAAEANNTSVANVSNVLCGRTMTCNGKRFCLVSKIMEHLEEINQENAKRAERERLNAEKMTERDAENARLEVIRNAKAKVARHKEKVAELEAELTNERRLVEEAEAEFKKACEEV
jgi:hypothetical protein